MGKLSFGSLRQWHWISSALCLVGMLLFAVTGITLNHAADIPATPKVQKLEITLSPAQRQLLQGKTAGSLPLALRRMLWDKHQLDIPAHDAEWTATELYLALPKPGGDAWLNIDFESGELLYENTERGAIAYLNDLHKGRNTSLAWIIFLDVFALLCLLFSLSGLWLLWRYAKQRPSTWPWVGLGFLVPVLIVILTIH